MKMNQLNVFNLKSLIFVSARSVAATRMGSNYVRLTHVLASCDALGTWISCQVGYRADSDPSSEAINRTEL